MRKFKAIATGVAAVLVLVGLPVSYVGAAQSNPQGDTGATVRADGVVAAAEPKCSRLSSANADQQDIFLGTTNPKVYTGMAWQDVNCTTTTFRLKPGQRALVVSTFSAEADCNGSVPTNGQWCEARAMLNGVEGQPQGLEPDSFAFDSVAGGVYNWNAHSMQRGGEVRCANADGCQYKFAIQTKMHDSTVTGMWLDEVAADIKVTIGAPAPL